MMRKALLALGAIIAIVIGAGFGVTYSNSTSREADEARAVALGIPYTDFNWNTAHAQMRGCNACHSDHLAADLSSNLVTAREKPELHGIFANTYGPLRVEDCLPCHGNSFADPIHSRHLFEPSFVKMGGNCQSCHAVVNGRFVLYDDETRYDVVNGVRYDATPAFTPSSKP